MESQQIDWQLKTPVRLVSIGPSAVGKTYTILQILRYREKIFDKKIDLVVFCYSHFQKEFNEFIDTDPGIVFISNKEILSDIITGTFHSCLIFDDMMVELASSNANFITEWYTRKSSHLNCSVISMYHNQFYNRNLRTVFLNATYSIYHANNRDRSSIIWVARQIFPTNSKFLVHAYNDAIKSKPFGFLFLDHSIERTTDELGVRNFVYPFLGCCYYLPTLSVEKGDKMYKYLRVIPSILYDKLVESGVLNKENTSLEIEKNEEKAATSKESIQSGSGTTEKECMETWPAEATDFKWDTFEETFTVAK